VNKYYKAIAAIRQIVRNPWLLNRVLEDNSYWVKQIKKYTGHEKGLPVISTTDIFGDFNVIVDPFAFLYGGSLPTDLALLKKLAGLKPGCTYFEIGTWRGESVANVAQVAEACYTLNLSFDEMKSLGLPQEYSDQHRFFSKHLKNVTHLEGNSKNYAFEGLGQKFDLIFIDGDHHFEMVKNDTEKVFRHLVHDHSIVVWHDYAFNPESTRFEVMAGILAGMPPNLRNKVFHVANTLCAVYLPDFTPDHLRYLPLEPAGHFKVDISFRKKED